jgi:acetyl-CoA decarbonylase/synthase complex subunit alpha
LLIDKEPLESENNLTKKAAHVKIEELKSGTTVVKNLELSIGKIIDDTWEEPQGPTPFPETTDLRKWDFKLLNRYKPFCLPFFDVCCLCTFGKCDLSGDKRGACGLNMATQQSRIVLLACCIGAATHIAHAHHLIENLTEKYGRNIPIDQGGLSINVEAPVTRLVCGIRPKTLKDLEDVLDYCEEQVTQCLSATQG